MGGGEKSVRISLCACYTGICDLAARGAWNITMKKIGRRSLQEHLLFWIQLFILFLLVGAFVLVLVVSSDRTPTRGRYLGLIVSLLVLVVAAFALNRLGRHHLSAATTVAVSVLGVVPARSDYRYERLRSPGVCDDFSDALEPALTNGGYHGLGRNAVYWTGCVVVECFSINHYQLAKSPRIYHGCVGSWYHFQLCAKTANGAVAGELDQGPSYRIVQSPLFRRDTRQQTASWNPHGIYGWTYPHRCRQFQKLQRPFWACRRGPGVAKDSELPVRAGADGRYRLPLRW